MLTAMLTFIDMHNLTSFGWGWYVVAVIIDLIYLSHHARM